MSLPNLLSMRVVGKKVRILKVKQKQKEHMFFIDLFTSKWPKSKKDLIWSDHPPNSWKMTLFRQNYITQRNIFPQPGYAAY